MANRIQQLRNMTSLLFIYVVFGPILHIFIIYNQNAAVFAIDVLLKSFIIISTHRRCHIANEMGFKHRSVFRFINRMHFFCWIRIYYVSRFVSRMSPKTAEWICIWVGEYFYSWWKLSLLIEWEPFPSCPVMSHWSILYAGRVFSMYYCLSWTPEVLVLVCRMLSVLKVFMAINISIYSSLNV